MGKELNQDHKVLFKKLIERENDTSTVIRKGLAIPHIIVQGENIFKILLVRAKTGIIFPNDQIVHTAFVLVGSGDERNLHLKVLAAIAQITQDTEFDKKWLNAANLDELKNIVLLAERHRGAHF
ncbi:MAG: PTS sugar transporter subunit IIA [Candidatus Omnitrophota bacterium]